MLTALFGALGDILHVAVVALERFAVLLERTPLGPFWPVGFVVVFQVLSFVLSRLAPELARDYRRRFAELWAGFQQWRHGTPGGEEQSKHAGTSSLVPAVIYCTQFVLLVLAIALVLVAVAVLFRLLQPRYVSARVVVEYGQRSFSSWPLPHFAVAFWVGGSSLGFGSRKRIGFGRHGRKTR